MMHKEECNRWHHTIYAPSASSNVPIDLIRRIHNNLVVIWCTAGELIVESPEERWGISLLLGTYKSPSPPYSISINPTHSTHYYSCVSAASCVERIVDSFGDLMIKSEGSHQWLRDLPPHNSMRKHTILHKYIPFAAVKEQYKLYSLSLPSSVERTASENSISSFWQKKIANFIMFVSTCISSTFLSHKIIWFIHSTNIHSRRRFHSIASNKHSFY